ncbi:MAG TPA: amino acid ABC transporter permease [Actinomycetota bacterium]|jgi:polar amino acid transport system permease protein|nr:amino acid ABC transporter permease [Actinomycetota bacterium]
MSQAADAVRRPTKPRGFRERLERWSFAVPWPVKLGIAYAVIAAAFVAAFAFVGFDTAWIRQHAWTIVREGLPLTLLICGGAIALATVLAMLGSLARLSRNPLAYALAGFYTSFFRGTPLLVQIFLIYFGLAEMGIRLGEAGYPFLRDLLVLSVVPAGIIALGFNYGAYMTEIFRAGIESVGHGQGEAADALGMTYRQKMRRIVLPQAVRVVIPPTGNEFIAMLKDSALVFTIGATELFRVGDLLGRRFFRSLEAYIWVAAVYWVLTMVFSYFQRRLERRLRRGYVRSDGAGDIASATASQPGVAIADDGIPLDWAKGGMGGPSAPQQPHGGGSRG